MESSLKKLDQQETKYTDKLNAALVQYTELQQQARDIDLMELDVTCQVIRHDKEREMLKQLQATYRQRFEPKMLIQSRTDIADLLGKTSEPVSIRQKLQRSYAQPSKQHLTKEHERER